MKWTISVAAMLVIATAGSARADDVENVYRLGEAAKAAGLAVGYSVSGWNQYLDINISSMLPGDAREVASGMCQYAHKQTWQRPWTIRVFLVVGERPAASCTTN